jgi:hypothetical protein
VNKVTTLTPDYNILTTEDIGIASVSSWNQIGVAYKNARGSITCYLSALPLNNALFLAPSTFLESPRDPNNNYTIVCEDKPTYLARVVKEINGKDLWTDIGVVCEVGGGVLKIRLTCLPLSDKVLLIPLK